jgi:hypothetical protein
MEARSRRAVWIVAAAVSWSGGVSAQSIRVSIDVKPGDTPTSIEADRGGLLPVAILSTRDFDASTVDPSTIRVGPTGTEAEAFRSMLEDVDRDGRADRLVLVRVQDLRVECSHTTLRLTGKTIAGATIEGSEAVTVQGCSPAP